MLFSLHLSPRRLRICHVIVRFTSRCFSVFLSLALSLYISLSPPPALSISLLSCRLSLFLVPLFHLLYQHNSTFLSFVLMFSFTLAPLAFLLALYSPSAVLFIPRFAPVYSCLLFSQNVLLSTGLSQHSLCGAPLPSLRCPVPFSCTRSICPIGRSNIHDLNCSRISYSTSNGKT